MRLLTWFRAGRRARELALSGLLLVLIAPLWLIGFGAVLVQRFRGSDPSKD